jgi:hypothetical protein
MERAKFGEPDDEDDIIEVHPRPPKRPIITKEPSKPPAPPNKPPPPPKQPGKGELNNEYGFYVERPFYIIS